MGSEREKKIIVDRIEGLFAVCEMSNGKTADIKLESLPEGVREGSVLCLFDGRYSLVPDEEKKRRKKLYEMQRSLFHKNSD